MTVVKVVVATAVFSAVQVLAKRSSSAGFWIAALPIMTAVSVAGLMMDRRTSSEIARFVVAVAWGIPPSAAFMFTAAILLKRGYALPVSSLAGAALWAVTVWTLRRYELLG
jgi:hypothetical protein